MRVLLKSQKELLGICRTNKVSTKLLCKKLEVAGYLNYDIKVDDELHLTEYATINEKGKKFVEDYQKVDAQIQSVGTKFEDGLLNRYYYWKIRNLVEKKDKLADELKTNLEKSVKVLEDELIPLNSDMFITSSIKKMCELKQMEASTKAVETLKDCGYCRVGYMNFSDKDVEIAKETQKGKIFLQTSDAPTKKVALKEEIFGNN